MQQTLIAPEPHREVAQRFKIRHLLFVALVLVAATSVLFAFLSEGSSSNRLATAICAALTTPILVRLALGKPIDVLHPTLLFSIFVFMGCVLPVSDFLEGTDPFTGAWYYPLANIESSLMHALRLVLFGVIAFYLGYAIGRLFAPTHTAGATLFWHKRRLVLSGLICTFVGIALFMFGVFLIGGPSSLIAGAADRTRAFAGLGYFFNGVLLLPSFALVWWAFLLTTSRRLTDWRFWSYAVFAFVLSNLLGSRANTFILLLAGVILYHLLRRRISVLVFAFLAVMGAVFFVFSAIIFREYLIVGRIVTIDVYSYAENPLVEMIRQRLMSEFFQIQVMTTLIDTMPYQVSFQNGSSYLFLLAGPIPSSIWPGKPLPSPGILTLALWPEKWLGQGTAMPPSLMGELYMNFSDLGVPIGMIIFGALFGSVRKWMHLNRHRLMPILSYSLLIACLMHYFRGAFPEATIVLLTFLIPIWLIIRFVMRAHRSDSAGNTTT